MALRLTTSSPVSKDVHSFTVDTGRISIGRSAECDWTLADPTNQLSSRHCEIAWVGDGYAVADSSTNGTRLNGEKLASARRINVGDVLAIGPYEIRVGDGRAEVAPASAGPAAFPGATPAASSDGLSGTLAKALAGLATTRARQRQEIGVRTPDPLASSPLLAADPAAALARLPAGGAERAVGDAVAAIDRHNAAALMAMQQALREAMATVSPTAIVAEAKLRPGLADEARDAALWRAYVARAERKDGRDEAFLESFAAAFTRAYEKLAALS